MASLYQARKQGAPLPPLPPSMLATPTSVKKGEANGSGGSHYDAATVEQIKAQFQAQIEAMMLSQVKKLPFLARFLYLQGLFLSSLYTPFILISLTTIDLE